MNESARTVLRDNKQKIREDLHLERDILEELEKEKILNEDQVHKIWAEKTNADKINELLSILPRRGPSAFQTFVDAIRRDSQWLAEFLEKALNKELEKCAQTNRHNMPSETSQPPANQIQDEDTPMPSPSGKNQDEDAPMPSPSSNSDATENTNGPVRSTFEFESTKAKYIPQMSVYSNPIVQQNLSSLYTKLKLHLTSNLMREPSFTSPQPVSFEMVGNLLEEMLQNMDKCYSILGRKDRTASLQTLLIDLKKKNTELKLELKTKDGQRNKYANNNMKLENRCREANTKIETLGKEKMALQTEIDRITAENDGVKEMLSVQTETCENEREHRNETEDNLKEKIEKLESQCKQYELELKSQQTSNQKMNRNNNGPFVVCPLCKKQFHNLDVNANNECRSNSSESKVFVHNPSNGVNKEFLANAADISKVPRHSPHHNDTYTRKPISEADRKSYERMIHNANTQHYNISSTLHMKPSGSHHARQSTRPSHGLQNPTHLPSFYRSTEFGRRGKFQSPSTVNIRQRNSTRPAILHSKPIARSLESVKLPNEPHEGKPISLTARNSHESKWKFQNALKKS